MLSLGESRISKGRGVSQSTLWFLQQLQLRIYITFISKLILQQMVLSLIRYRCTQNVIYKRADYAEFF